MNRCADCVHARAVRDQRTVLDIGRGEPLQCWRYPPVPVGGPTSQGMAVGTFRPIVAADDVCGEFMPKPEAAN